MKSVVPAVLLCLALLLYGIDDAVAQRYPRHAASANYSGFVMYGSLSAEYEFIASEQVSLRLGLGGAYGSVVVDNVQAEGGTALFSFMSRGRNKVEVGIGFSIMRTNFTMIFDEDEATPDTRMFPALSLAYRYMPARSGSFFRIGIGWMYGYGLPVTFSYGWVF